MNGWIEEQHKAGVRLGLRLKERLFTGQSPYQKVEIYESTDHGRVLMNDDCFMLCERDERIYHEMIAHVPLHVHPHPSRVLIIGGGDGGAAREVLRHRQVERCVMVEIDVMVIEACQRFIPQTSASLASDSRLELRIEDGVAYMRDSLEIFDVILIDSTDPTGFALPLFGSAFYADIAARLASDGVLVAQSGSSFYEPAVQEGLLKITAAAFPLTAALNFTNMTYPGGLWSFVWASRGPHPLRDLRPSKGLEMYYYNQGTHIAAFQLPEFQRQALAAWTRL